MFIIADLHIHSKYSRAVSKDMTIPNIGVWARRKGIDLVATGDFTHPLWLREIESTLAEDGKGFLKEKPGKDGKKFPTRFLLSTEISCIFSQNGKTRRVHTLVWVSTIDSARRISQEITKRGGNILSDGRPILGFSLIQLAELIFSVDPEALVVPAHIWTPWFSVYGSMGGFDSLEEAFGPYAEKIYAVETGLSSNPEMNWRVGELETRSIVSFSDAHSGRKLGREATVFEMPELTFENLRRALMGNAVDAYSNLGVLQSRTDRNKERGRAPSVKNSNLNKHLLTDEVPHIAYTIEFYPEEGKYHYTGHRDCNIRFSPEEVAVKGTTCPVCGRSLTQGVMQRVEQLATIPQKNLRMVKKEDHSIAMYASDAQRTRPPYMMLVPLIEIVAESVGTATTSKKAVALYDFLLSKFGSEFAVLLKTPIDQIAENGNAKVADGVRKVRTGDIVIEPGYDGVFGVVKIWKDEKGTSLVDASKEQMGLFLILYFIYNFFI